MLLPYLELISRYLFYKRGQPTSFAVSNSKTIRRKHFFRRYVDEIWLKRGL